MDWIGILDIASQQGCLLGLVAVSVAISYRVLDFPDLTVDGSFALGGAVCATMIVSGYSPLTATLAATVFGALSGCLTGLLNAKMRISRILAGILVMTMLYTVNLRIMGRPNVSLLTRRTLVTYFEKPEWQSHLPLIGFYSFLIIAVIVLLGFLFRTNLGILLLAIGNNDRAALASGYDPGNLRILGLAIANSLSALSGAVLAQSFGFADIGMGVGIIVIGFASLLVGEALLPPKTVNRLILAAILGSFIYQVIAAVALRAGLAPTDLKLATSFIVIFILSFHSLKNRGLSSEGA